VLDDIAADALSGAVVNGLSIIAREGGVSSLKVWRKTGARAIEDGAVEREIQALRFTLDTTLGVSALAMRPGGVRVCGIVFCATHYPAGTDARFRLSCPKCSPDDTMLTGRTPDPRNVVSIEGTI
jgi:hypothetical protein